MGTSPRRRLNPLTRIPLEEKVRPGHDGRVLRQTRSTRCTPRRWTSAHNKRRSRSSTIASLAVPRSLSHHDSHSSIRTVTAAGGETTSMRSVGGKDDKDGKAETGSTSLHQGSTVASVRPKSSTMSELVLNAAAAKAAAAAGKGIRVNGFRFRQSEAQMTERRIESIRVEDRRFKETTLAALIRCARGVRDEVPSRELSY